MSAPVSASPVRHRILVTGANGFVGTWLTALLRSLAESRPIEVVAAGQADSCDISFDIADERSVSRAIKETLPTAVVHLAAIAAPAEAKRDPAAAWRVNFQGTMNIASTILSLVPECKFIFASSSEVYGATFEQAAGTPVDETRLLQPKTVYAASKAAADIAVGQMSYDGLRSIRFRPFNHTGPGQGNRYVVSAFAEQIASIMDKGAKPVIEVGNIEVCRDFLDVRDVVRAYATAALADDRSLFGKVFNLASGKAVQIKTILDMLVRLSGQSVDIVVSPTKTRQMEVPVAVGSALAAKAALDWQPTIDLEATVSAVLDSWREQGK